ncbi:MAG: tRNA (cytidine(56)-2'-O)-methyltransferase [Cuniculiplasma sp.]
MTEVTVYRYGHRPMRDKRVTTHVALTARAFGASGITVDTSDEQLEESVKKVVDEFGGNFSIKTGVSLDRFLRNSKGIPIIHLTMYGIPLNQSQEKLDELVSKNEKIIVFVGAEKVPGRVYGTSTLNISVTSQPISEISALAMLLDRMHHGKDLSEHIEGRLKIIPMERGKKVEVIPSRYQCMEILREKNAEPEIIEKSVGLDENAKIMASSLNCNKAFVSACALLYPLFSRGRIEVLEGVPESITKSLIRILEFEQGKLMDSLSLEEKIIIDSMSNNSDVDQKDEDMDVHFKDLM